MLSQAASARWVERLVPASDTWVTVTIPPKATRVAAAAATRRRPDNHFEDLASRRYFDLRMVTPFLDTRGGRWSRPRVMQYGLVGWPGRYRTRVTALGRCAWW